MFVELFLNEELFLYLRTCYIQREQSPKQRKSAFLIQVPKNTILERLVIENLAVEDPGISSYQIDKMKVILEVDTPIKDEVLTTKGNTLIEEYFKKLYLDRFFSFVIGYLYFCNEILNPHDKKITDSITCFMCEYNPDYMSNKAIETFRKRYYRGIQKYNWGILPPAIL